MDSNCSQRQLDSNCCQRQFLNYNWELGRGYALYPTNLYMVVVCFVMLRLYHGLVMGFAMTFSLATGQSYDFTNASDGTL